MTTETQESHLEAFGTGSTILSFVQDRTLVLFCFLSTHVIDSTGPIYIADGFNVNGTTLLLRQVPLLRGFC